MLEAFGWGLVAASSLVLGGVLALKVRLAPRTLGLVMAFGSGVLISAVAYELVLEASTVTDGLWTIAGGLLVGAFVFAAGDWLIDRGGGEHRKSMAGRQAEGSGSAIVLGIVLDGLPESVVIGLSLLGGEQVSATLLAAVFLSNVPEAASATTGLVGSGHRRDRILGLWVLVMLASGLAAALGYAIGDDLPPDALAFVLAFAGGAVLTMLADTMMPEAFVHAGRLAGLATTVGFALAFAIGALQ